MRTKLSKSYKRISIYFNPKIFRILKIKSIETSRSISEIVNDYLRYELTEDAEDLKVFNDRANEETVSFEKVLKNLRT